MNMKIFIIISALIAVFTFTPLDISAQANAPGKPNDAAAKPAENAQQQASSDKRGEPAAFSVSRDPFLSKEEVESIERARQDEIKRIEQERKRLMEAERARLEELEERRRREEELRKNPSREIINKISIDGIVGSEAIINGQFKKIGDHILGAKITKVGDSSVTFIYKGQTFVKKLSASGGIGVL
jgi:hypothetical protein